ncbi:hypothetical protein XELAEV_18028746mg [Xenopus laevis]|uniref:Uncharacterized protein n=1 Tax=Xenopus laevis TaxID=8355 RepID=A0A974CQ69_XENLA|nr:hypothetical protein XELAEV_18028746mg [Xenopus laevis]
MTRKFKRTRIFECLILHSSNCYKQRLLLHKWLQIMNISAANPSPIHCSETILSCLHVAFTFNEVMNGCEYCAFFR